MLIKEKNSALQSIEAVLISEWSMEYHFWKKGSNFLKKKNKGQQKGNVVL